MVWARQKRPEMAKTYPELSNSEISSRLGSTWNELTDQQKQPYFDEAQRLKMEHQRAHPDWVYNPKPKKPKSPSDVVAGIRTLYGLAFGQTTSTALGSQSFDGVQVGGGNDGGGGKIQVALPVRAATGSSGGQTVYLPIVTNGGIVHIPARKVLTTSGLPPVTILTPGPLPPVTTILPPPPPPLLLPVPAAASASDEPAAMRVMEEGSSKSSGAGAGGSGDSTDYMYADLDSLMTEFEQEISEIELDNEHFCKSLLDSSDVPPQGQMVVSAAATTGAGDGDGDDADESTNDEQFQSLDVIDVDQYLKELQGSKGNVGSKEDDVVVKRESSSSPPPPPPPPPSSSPSRGEETSIDDGQD